MGLSFRATGRKDHGIDLLHFCRHGFFEPFPEEMKRVFSGLFGPELGFPVFLADIGYAQGSQGLFPFGRTAQVFRHNINQFNGHEQDEHPHEDETNLVSYLINRIQ